MKIIVADSETDGLAYECTKLHVFSWTETCEYCGGSGKQDVSGGWGADDSPPEPEWETCEECFGEGIQIESTNDYNKMREVIQGADLIVMHNAVRHDMVVFNRLLGIPMDYTKYIDTLIVSWYLYPDRASHGLAAIGEEHGVKKPEVDDWEGLSYEEYKHRCQEDTKINHKEWDKCWKRLNEIYDTEEDIFKFLRYLSFKADCLREQEQQPLTLDVAKAQKHYDELTEVIEDKTVALAKVMPKAPGKMQNKPKNLYKQDGSYSAHGKKWFDTLKELKLPPETEGPVVTEWVDGNPKSTQQIKEWLESLGWRPCTFKYQRNKLTGEEKKIPQVRYVAQSDPRKGQLTDSVLRLKEREPAIEELEGLTVAQHRRGIFEGFLSEHRGGKIISSAGGLTNTLRFKHRKPIVNLPGVDAAWGKEIRGCIVAEDDTQVLCGADVSSLESCTKRHLMWEHDPEYVTEMSQPGFDEHLNLAKFAGKVTQEDIDRYNEGKAPELKPLRSKFKATNYSAVYGVGAPKLARETGMTQKEAQELLKAYWGRNWAVEKLAKDQYVKTLKDGSMWLKNPVSGFYYSLRYDKDRFSTLNQGLGVYIFDLWVANIRKLGIKVSMQYHDEVLFSVPKGQEEQTEGLLKQAMDKVNDTLKLNVTIGADAEFGSSYDQCH